MPPTPCQPIYHLQPPTQPRNSPTPNHLPPPTFPCYTAFLPQSNSPLWFCLFPVSTRRLPRTLFLGSGARRVSTQPACSPRRPRVPPHAHVFPRTGRPIPRLRRCREDPAAGRIRRRQCGRTPTVCRDALRSQFLCQRQLLHGRCRLGWMPRRHYFWAFCVSAITESHLRVEPGWDRRQSEQRPASRTTKSLARSGQRVDHSLKLTGRPLRGRLRQPGRTIRCWADRRRRPAAEFNR